MLKQIVATLAAIMICSTSWAETCRTESLSQSTPTKQFTLSNDVVMDKETTLSWMRCAVGQHWDGQACHGKAKTVAWSEAMAMVEKINTKGTGGHNDWRMPMVPELASIVERQCFNPRMNTAVFPGAPSAIFWTSMEKMGTTDYAYSLDFGGGQAVATAKDHVGAIRLVRGGPWWQPPTMSAR